jgi:CheY-like chemotaxis protein
MRIVLIDDEPAVLYIMAALIRRLGHVVTEFADPRAAVAALTADEALILSDVNMPNLDGFEVARCVRERFGDSAPRVLLVSGNDQDSRLAEVPPSIVLGVLAKPLLLGDLERVLLLVEQSRTRCPGTLRPLCRNAEVEFWEAPAGDADTRRPCHAATYAACPLFDCGCGQALRAWIKPAAASAN